MHWTAMLVLAAAAAVGGNLWTQDVASQVTEKRAGGGAETNEVNSPIKDKAESKRPHLDQIKRLTGTWVSADNPKQVVTTYRVTAGGSAVLETVFPGADHEMITLYYMDGKDLVLTHYCVMGNQPHMKAVAGLPADRLAFQCDPKERGANIQANTAHMNRGEYRFKGPDRMASKWTAVEGDRIVHEVEFDLIRRKDPIPKEPGQ